jgi:glycine hydroxymethyltransferase
MRTSDDHAQDLAHDEGLDDLTRFDPEMAQLLATEERRQLESVNLIASENYASPLALRLEGSIFANKNAEGYPGRRVVAGCDLADQVEQLAVKRLKALFRCEHANVQAMSATIANLALLNAVLEPGDTLMAMRLNDGGHLSHGAPFHDSGKRYRAVFYGVNRDTEQIDMGEVSELAAQSRPKLIVCGGSSYPRHIDYQAFATIARANGAMLWADIAHTVGLIAAGVVPSPIPHADFVTSSTHKTWRGPRGCGIILCRQVWADRIDRSIFPGIQGAPKLDMIAARTVFFKETSTPLFRAYAAAVLDNAQVLAEALADSGIRLVSGGTDTHLILIDVRDHLEDGAYAEKLLASVGIMANRNPIPFDQAPSMTGSGLRLGSPAMTTRGLDDKGFFAVGKLIGRLFNAPEDHDTHEAVRLEIKRLVDRLPLFSPHWLPLASPGNQTG